MATNGLGCLIMTAVIDPRFREQLLADPAEAITDFDLAQDERQALVSIRAGSFTELAARLHNWLEQRDLLQLGLRKDPEILAVDGAKSRRDAGAGHRAAEPRTARTNGPAQPAARPLEVAAARSMQPRYDTEESKRLAVSICLEE